MSAGCWEMACRWPGLMREACGLRVRRTQHLNIQVFPDTGTERTWRGEGSKGAFEAVLESRPSPHEPPDPGLPAPRNMEPRAPCHRYRVGPVPGPSRDTCFLRLA